ncbi:MAG: Plasmid stabilization system [Candidatus Kaiserbacteria bacterium GW2011_GWC2_49_12]|uniref:Plasmid stabilization system n=5 Tax=Parcubacteria group TaxID=1794811 RepID=A0A0G1ZLW3_9BACT|nr:MAG: Plasmid stabilization system [Candidatus Kaiserbacteria bacterium GW2011_GWC2_49_12]KKW17115.1 MAG: Plasmid stabilization system [Candidatus Kaiserbacteria bacterium GW2011_GWB1_50_17]KKW17925.1 MAG: Plasmid stabilization system [Candidatus Kaiserbacteria bacterium GW2011_GWA1_50_28]KKW20414.1 MAG: Plasmid stabilization system [Candidatus Adlerbacteria bacterium GW2011_GWC1_50_9]OGG86972.1 MAG: hypothetical protein A3H15_00255 [Candidatus Kaiserbacteria bacterium RIFCSPLOWO2_12_FULL_50_
MKVRITKVALAELRDIHAYIAKNNPAAANAVIEQVERVVGVISTFPGIARPINKRGLYMFPALPFPYLIFYTVGKREVIIRNVRHAGRMRP